MFEPMTCTTCGETIQPDLSRAGRKAQGFETLVYRCACGTGFSNSTKLEKRRRVMRSPELNVPAEVHSGLAEALAGAANVGNLRHKRDAFCSEVSEDAVTWTIFAHLEASGQLARLDRARAADTSPDLLLWGHPVAGDTAPELADQLAAVSADLGEYAERRSEPDVIVAWPDQLVFVEAKLTSKNKSTKPEPAGKFERYWNPDAFREPCDGVARLGFYELVRNWRIGIDLATRSGQSGFELINLGPPDLNDDLEQLRPQLATTPTRRLSHRTWNNLLEPDDPAWLRDFAASRGVSDG